jgi:hypothetical protein
LCCCVARAYGSTQGHPHPTPWLRVHCPSPPSAVLCFLFPPPPLHTQSSPCSSLTKFYSGARAIAGAAMFRSRALFEQAERFMLFSGVHVSDANVRLVLEGMVDLDTRVAAGTSHVQNNGLASLLGFV